MYVAFVALGLCFFYFVLSYGLAIFFSWDWPRFTWRTMYSLAIILVTATAVIVAVESAPSLELANRIQHAFGGGFLAFLTCFLVAKDMGRPITRFQFFVLSFLIVTALGVANEIFEFVMQDFFGFYFAKHLNDTWLDLVSNTVGALTAALILVPLIRKGGNTVA
jgi:hypothetical protein